MQNTSGPAVGTALVGAAVDMATVAVVTSLSGNKPIRLRNVTLLESTQLTAAVSESMLRPIQKNFPTPVELCLEYKVKRPQ